MRRRALATFAAGCVLGIGGLAVVAATDERRLAFTLGAAPQWPVAVLHRTQVACQRDVDVAAPFDRVEILLGTFSRPGPPLEVSVLETGTGHRIAAGSLPAGAADNRPAGVQISSGVPARRRVAVCVRNDGPGRVALYGGPETDAPASTAYVGVFPVTGDLRMTFYRDEPRSALALAPDMLERASVFRPAPIGAWFSGCCSPAWWPASHSCSDSHCDGAPRNRRAPCPARTKVPGRFADDACLFCGFQDPGQGESEVRAAGCGCGTSAYPSEPPSSPECHGGT